MSEQNRPSPRRSDHHQTCATGATLLELLVVMAILATLASLFPLAIRRLIPARRLAAAAQALVIDLRNLQAQSSISGQPLQLVLEPSGYTLQRVSTAEVGHVRLPNDLKVTLMVDERAHPASALVMYPDGSSSGGEFELRTEQHLTTVTVSPLTGRVRVSR